MINVARTYHSVNHISGFPRYPQLNDYNYDYMNIQWVKKGKKIRKK